MDASDRSVLTQIPKSPYILHDCKALKSLFQEADDDGSDDEGSDDDIDDTMVSIGFIH